jgi:hypothetical protein
MGFFGHLFESFIPRAFYEFLLTEKNRGRNSCSFHPNASMAQQSVLLPMSCQSTISKSLSDIKVIIDNHTIYCQEDIIAKASYSTKQSR